MSKNKDDQKHEERIDFYEMRHRMHSLRDRDYRTHNKSGCMISLITIPVLLIAVLSLIFGS